MPKTITSMQELQFQIMKASRFNEFNGEQVVNDLIANPTLWKGALMRVTGITLRDLPHDVMNADEIIISVPRTKIAEFLAMIDSWKIDECDEMERTDINDRDFFRQAEYRLGSTSEEKEFAVYRLWWD